VIVRLPWPDRRLSPNARLHWSKRPVKQARADGAKAAYEAMGGTSEARARLARMDLIPLKVTFYPPDNRHRDEDNMVASLKAARDGIADALGVNDRKFRCLYFIGAAEKPGRVGVELFGLSTVGDDVVSLADLNEAG
jgi:crossover junction endodeoxyribonuclease RusA